MLPARSEETWVLTCERSAVDLHSHAEIGRRVWNVVTLVKGLIEFVNVSHFLDLAQIHA